MRFNAYLADFMLSKLFSLTFLPTSNPLTQLAHVGLSYVRSILMSYVGLHILYIYMFHKAVDVSAGALLLKASHFSFEIAPTFLCVTS
jgi:hypothetical protein